MIFLLGAVCFLCLLAVAHSYLVYPALLLRASARRCHEYRVSVPVTTWPKVHVLMAVHNEEVVLPQKLRSLAQLSYPGELSVHIVSDHSTDGTDGLLRNFAGPDRMVTYNDQRRGKPASINRLAADLPRKGIYVFTDASVMLRPDTVTELVRPLAQDADLGVSDAVMVHTGVPTKGVGRLEDAYIRREVELKRAAGCLYAALPGPFGGCWALRARAFRPVPDAFLVDDFYLCLAAYEQGYGGVTAPGAYAEEGVGIRIGDEFRRKRRIGAGNWQNLVRFRKLWWPPWRDARAYVLFSHKILRWISPYLLVTGALSGLTLIACVSNYRTAAAFVLIGLAACGFSPALRYFTAMNVALLIGGVDYLTGIKSNVWQPSHRNEDLE